MLTIASNGNSTHQLANQTSSLQTVYTAPLTADWLYHVSVWVIAEPISGVLAPIVAFANNGEIPEYGADPANKTGWFFKTQIGPSDTVQIYLTNDAGTTAQTKFWWTYNVLGIQI